MDLELHGRNAVVTGASSGIGAGIVRVLSREGVNVAAVARRADKLRELADIVGRESQAKLITVEADVTNVDAIGLIATDAAQRVGPIEILVNCAGGSRPTKPESGDDVWDEAFALNFTATRRLTTALLPAMRARSWGRIVNISGSMEPRSLNAAAAAKGAVHLWAKGLSCDVAADGVTINTIQPGRINSEQILQKLHPTEAARRDFIQRNIPIGYFGDPQDIATLVAFLVSPVARYITGAVIPVDGGMHYYAH